MSNMCDIDCGPMGYFKCCIACVATIIVISTFGVILNFEFILLEEKCGNNYTVGDIIREEGDAIGIVFTSCPSTALLESFTQAAATWNDIVLETNIEPARIGRLGIRASLACSFIQNDAQVDGNFNQDFHLIFVDLAFIDGRGGILGQAGPCVRDSTGRPIIGGMILDEADMRIFSGTELINNVVLHEIAHTLGFGVDWAQEQLLENPIFAGKDINILNVPKYIGSSALDKYDVLTGISNSFVPVEDGRINGVFNTFNPVEDPNSGRGSIDVHWKSESIGDELMVAFFRADGTIYPLSVLTVGAIEDLGYTVDYSAADPFSIDGTASPLFLNEELLVADVIEVEQKSISFFTKP